MSVEWKGRETLERLASQLEALAKSSIAVGIPTESDGPSMRRDKDDNKVPYPELNLATLAAILEFGSAECNIKERPFLRRTLKENQGKYTALFKTGLESGEAPDKLLQNIALVAQADVQENIVKGDWEVNEPATIKRKKSSKPLIDTGHLRQSIKGVVR